MMWTQNIIFYIDIASYCDVIEYSIKYSTTFHIKRW